VAVRLQGKRERFTDAGEHLRMQRKAPTQRGGSRNGEWGINALQKWDAYS
jgi:hypothetical protein